MTFQLAPDQVAKSWATLKVEVVFDPTTGVIKPWEVRGVFTFPHDMSVHWSSHKTEAAARKSAVKAEAKARAFIAAHYPPAE